MKGHYKRPVIIFSILVLFLQQGFAQRPYTLKGRFSTPYTGKLHLRYNGQLITAMVQNGEFAISGAIDLPVRATIALELPRILHPQDFFLDPGEQAIIVDTSTLMQGSVPSLAVGVKFVQGGNSQAFAEKTTQEIKEALRGTADTYILQRKIREELTRRFKEAPHSMVLLSMVSDNITAFNGDQLYELYRLMDDTMRASAFAVDIKQFIDKDAAALVGTVLPDFTQQDTSGRAVAVSSLRGKYVLVDFWASWCRPCRNENPALVSIYNRFKGKGFEILGVSLDAQRQSWLQAIRSDGLPWMQVSDLRGWQNAAARQFKIKYIPDNILIDPEGRIIAKDVHGEALARQLQQVL